MKILYIAHRIPYPPNKGDKIRSFNEIKYLSQNNDIDLACLVDNSAERLFVDNLRKYCRKVAAIPLDTVAATLRGAIGFMGGSPISIDYFFKRPLQEIINQWFRETRYDAVICFSSPTAEYVFRSRIFQDAPPRTSPTASGATPVSSRLRRPILVMDFCDVDSDKWGQFAEESDFPLNRLYRWEFQRLLEYEKRIHQIFHHSIFVSPPEAALFRKYCPEAEHLTVVPNGVDHEYFTPEFNAPVGLSPSSTGLPASLELEGNLRHRPMVLLFTGAMDYYPNIEGVLWFCRKVYPHIKRRFPETRFYIVGSRPAKKIKALHHGNDIFVTGFVEDVRPYYQAADVCLAPLRLARGVQNKVLEAMAMKKPIVSTSKANQGIGAVSGEHLCIADSPADFVKTVSELVENPEKRKDIGSKGRSFVLKHHCWAKNMSRIENLLRIAESA
jgi:sugar transferase (PEP-CTERM/EpsH1 system associated)